MLSDDLQQQLKNLEPDLATINSFWKNANIESRIKELKIEANKEDFWKHPEQANISKELQKLKNQYEQYSTITTTHKDYNELIELFADDENELKKIIPEIEHLEKLVATFKISILLNKPEDTSNCFISINAGAGGTESQDWASILLRMYTRFCEQNRLTARIIDYQDGEEAGIKSATLFIKGKNAFGLIKSEHGVHRLVRISPFDANKRRHTSFASISITPETPEIEVDIDTNDLRIDTYCASGAGGQHVNRTESAVRITHIPTGIVTQCQNERSQLQNKETAMKMLRAKMAQKIKEEQEVKRASVEKKKIGWGSQIRSYVLHPYKMVKDHRTNFESGQPDVILDGNLISFIEKYLVWINTQ